MSETEWMCVCGEVHGDHCCGRCGQEPPWGCECPEHDAYEGHGYDDADLDDPMADRYRCVLGDRCLFPDPYHFASECFDEEMAEAMHAAYEGDDADG